ncbi:MAG: hypothetical protein ACK2UK_18010 [Candidatus Promineifilaceae bacterium]|jgi:hypothetical protein
MPTDYEKVYQQQRHALGDLTKELVAFFDQYENQNASVRDARLKLLQRLIHATRDGGDILIADQKSKLPSMKETFEHEGDHWTIQKQARGFLFVRKDR